jgi:transposase
MRYIEGQSRDQVLVFPEVIDDYVSKDNPVRFIDVFINMLDMIKLDFTHSQTSKTGRKPYNPKDLLKLYIYGYMNHIRSSRKLEIETHRNIEIIWLLKKLQPDFKTISDFRKDNSRALKKVFRQFVMLCKGWGLYGNELVAIDGSKFKANNNKRRCYTIGQLKKTLKEINEKIESYLRELNESDESEESGNADIKLESAKLQEKIDQLKETQKKYKQYERKLQESGEKQISLTDPDSRLMKVNNSGMEVCYNVQTAIDSKHKLVSDFDVTNEGNDLNQLSNMSNKAKEALGVDELEVVADKGYFKRKEIKKCAKNNITCYVPQPRKSHNRKKGLFTDKDFVYDNERDCYICPAGNFLYPTSYSKERDERIYSTSKCLSCSLKNKCTRNKYRRRINRWIYESIIEEMSKRVKENPDKIKARACIVEHPFGTIKRAMNQGYFLTRGLEGVKGEFSITMLAYNIKRVLNILSVEKLVQSMAMTINEKVLSPIYSFIMNYSRILRQIIGEIPIIWTIFLYKDKNTKLRFID